MNKIKSKPLSYKKFDRITGLQDEIGLKPKALSYESNSSTSWSPTDIRCLFPTVPDVAQRRS